MRRPLLITDEIKAKILAQVAWAERPENWFRAHVDAEPPGDNPAFVMMLELGYRVVYSHTVMPDGKEYRHLSISVPGDKYPNKLAAFTIATLFGFTGGQAHAITGATFAPGPWAIQIDKDARAVVIAQYYKDA